MFKFIASLLMVAGLALPAPAQTIDRIQTTGALKLGVRTDAIPLSFIDKNGQPSGYSPMLCAVLAQGIANALKMEKLDVSFVAAQTENQFDLVANGDIDLLCGAATITLARRAVVDFSIPVYVDGASILIARDALTDLTNPDRAKKIGVRAATTTEGALQAKLAEGNINAELVPYESHLKGITAMQNSEIDAYLADRSILFGLLISQNLSQTHMIADQILTVEKQGLALARGDSEFRLLVDTILSELYKNGTIQNIFSKTFPGAEPSVAIRAMTMISPTLP